MAAVNHVKCPNCGSLNVSCMDGTGAVSKYGRNVMLDIAPEIWICNDCRTSFQLFELMEGGSQNEAENH